jgi:hypothetical protein
MQFYEEPWITLTYHLVINRGTGVMKDKELKLEESKTSRTLGGTGEGET